mmetsp:Transcript_29980/g.65605  ORF Transcript_29980/g.65605 Transcript_29980/m.65605 type:complete len:95 (+) Transcript_29980:836-1120(+)
MVLPIVFLVVSFLCMMRVMNSPTPVCTAEFASDIFMPLAEMTPFTITNVLPNLLRLNFVSGLSGFILEYQITAAQDVGSSGRNFLFTGYALPRK